MDKSKLNALALAALLVLTFPLPDASAQGANPAPALCFDKDPKGPNAATFGPEDVGSSPQTTKIPDTAACPGGFPAPPNYYEWSRIFIQLYNVNPNATGNPYIRVTCATNCHELADSPESPHRYFARWSGQPLIFPQDFHDEGPPGGRGGNALADRAPRYNSTWQVSALLPGTELTRSVNVWLMSNFLSTNLTVMPGEQHEIYASGIEPNASADLRIERLTATNGYVPIPLNPPPPRTPDSSGRITYIWTVPKDEAVRIAECPPGHVSDCYRVVVTPSSSTKQKETVNIRVSVANLKVSYIEGQYAKSNGAAPSTPEPIERTRNVTLAIGINYPGGRLNFGPSFSPSDLQPAADGGERALRVRVEKTNRSSPTAIQITEIPLAYDRGRWSATWTIARDIPIEADAEYTLRLVEARDLWGNRIPSVPLGSYRVTAATLQPTLIREPLTVERAGEATMAFRIQYHNGSVFTAADNATPLRGCFYRDSGGFPPSCPPPGGRATEATYENGLWVFRTTYARDYGSLGDHRFVLVGGSETQDKWRNQVNSTTTSAFSVIAASPQVKFATVMRGLTTNDLERGERIGISAIITYDDGRPFNHTVRSTNEKDLWTRYLNVTVTKRGENDAIQDAQIIQLQEVDVAQGLWVGSMDLPLSASQTPIGRWSFALRVNDSVTPIPNVNETVFDRNILPAPIRYQQTRLSPTTPFAGSSILYEFQLHYTSQTTANGPEVPADTLRSGLTAQVYRWDVKNRTAFGEPLSGLIQPEYDTSRHVWVVRYQVPGNLFNNTFVLKVDGRDTSGNRLPQDAWSSPFTPQSRVKDRQVLTQPPNSVQRGEAATVVFAAQDGDSGIDGTGEPIITVERWNSVDNRWDPVATGSNARQSSPEIHDHLGVFGVTTTTAIGTYRFVLLGREAGPSFAIISSVSGNYTVLPTEVTRAIYHPPQQLVTKGDLVWFTTEYHEGDTVTLIQLLYNGREIKLARPLLAVEGDHINATWRVPFEAPNGNYTIHIEGRDIYGNLLTFDTPNIEAVAAQLTGKVIGNPPKIAKRGEETQIIFGITYPSGKYYNAIEIPSVIVFNDTGIVATADVVRTDSTFVATWLPPAIAGLGDYWFEVNGQGVGGNSFPNLRSPSFRLAPGEFERKGANDIPVGTERLATNTFAVGYEPDDRSASFTLAYYGQTVDTNAIADKAPLTLTPLPQTLDSVAGRYVARFVSDPQTPLGAYRIFMKGEDRLGNIISSQSNIFIVRATTIIVTWEDQPAQSKFVEGGTIQLTFAARYKNGPILDDQNGRPNVALLLDNQPTTQKPDTQYINGKWVVTWTAPELLKDGAYTFAVGGADIAGNTIATSRSIPYNVQTPISNSFAKVIPGPEPWMLVIAFAAIAAIIGRKKLARDE